MVHKGQNGLSSISQTSEEVGGYWQRLKRFMVGFLAHSCSVGLLHSLFCRTQDISACEEGALGSETQHRALKLEAI